MYHHTITVNCNNKKNQQQKPSIVFFDLCNRHKNNLSTSLFILTMYKYTIIYLFIILSTTESTNLPFKELKTILTKKDLQDWLYNETAQHSSKNKYCRLCCINVGAETIGKKCGSHTMCKYPVSSIVN